MYNAGDFNTTETVHIPINSFTSDDPTASCTVTNLAVGDIEIHKDGSTTQRTSDNGVTVDIDFDSVTGNHMIHIDLSDNTDAGFYSSGSRYLVRIEGATVDGGTINAWVGGFSIDCVLRPTTAGRTLDIQATGEVDANVTMIGGDTQSEADLKDFADTGYDPSTHKVQGVVLTDTCTTNTDMRGTDSAATEAKQDVIDGIVDDILEDTAEIGAAGAGLTEAGGTGDHLTAVPWNASWDAEVQSECADALTAAGLTATDIVTELWAKVIDTTRTFGLLMKHLMAFIVGDSVTNRTASGVEMTYYAEDGETTQMKASITETGRTITEEGS